MAMESGSIDETTQPQGFDLSGSWEVYRGLLDKDYQGLEIPGMTYEEFSVSLGDSRTAVFGLPTSEYGSGLAVPLVSPMDIMEWYNLDYFRTAAQQAGFGRDLTVVSYEHFEQLYRSHPDAYISALSDTLLTTAESNGLMAADHLDLQTEQFEASVGEIFTALKISAKDILKEVDPQARHYNHASAVDLADPEQALSPPLDFVKAYERGLRQGVFAGGDGVAVEQALTDKDIEDVWDYYESSFSELTSNDPIVASSPRQEFEELLKAPEVVKIVERLNGKVVSLCMFGAAGIFPWVNQKYFETAFPEQQEKGLVFFFPGVIRDPESRGDGRRVMAAMGRLISLAGIEKSVLAFICDKVSERPVTVIGNWALNKTGVVTDVTARVSERVFRAYLLGRTDG